MDTNKKTIKTIKRPTVEVTQEDIDTAIPKDSGHCMIADAIKHSIPNAKTVSVDVGTIRFTDKKSGERYTYVTPYFAQQALQDFDYGVKPNPFKFQLRTLVQVRQRLNTHARKAKLTIAVEKHGKETQDSNRHGPILLGGQPIARPQHGRIRRFGLRQMPSGIPAGQPQVPTQPS